VLSVPGRPHGDGGLVNALVHQRQGPLDGHCQRRGSAWVLRVATGLGQDGCHQAGM
jgi:hypothetical protein